MNRFLTRFFKTNCSKEPVRWNESDFTPQVSKRSRFWTTITAVCAYLYFMDPIINQDTLLPVHFPRTNFKAVTLFIPRVRLEVVPKTPIQRKHFNRNTRALNRSACVSVHTAAAERRERDGGSHTMEQQRGSKPNPTLIFLLRVNSHVSDENSPQGNNVK